MKPLEGIVVLDFSQYLAGPSAALRLADLGARVIKIERKGSGEANRALALKNKEIDGSSLLFHTINRNKESYAVDLKDSADLEKVKKLIAKADVLIENFRPGVMEKLHLDYQAVRKINERIVYGSVTGYGRVGPWKRKPGQDLLVQAYSGLAYLNGNDDQPPVPFPLAVADMFTGAHLVQGILACLIRREKTKKGGFVETSLIESIIDVQFEVLTTHLNDGRQLPQRSRINNAHAYLGAPYGVYETQDGYLSLAMGSIIELAEIVNCPELLNYEDPKSWFEKRDEIKFILVKHLKQEKTAYWLEKLDAAGYWSAEVLTWKELFAHEGFQALQMVQTVNPNSDKEMKTTRCPIRFNEELLVSSRGAPRVGEHNERIEGDFQL